MENNRSRLVAALGSLLVGSCSVVVGLVAPASAQAMPPRAPEVSICRRLLFLNVLPER
jgi:hypothetical protein